VSIPQQQQAAVVSDEADGQVVSASSIKEAELLEADDGRREQETRPHPATAEPRPATAEDIDNIIHGKLHLVRLDLSEAVFEKDSNSGNDSLSYKGQVKGVFCRLHYDQQKKDPSKGKQVRHPQRSAPILIPSALRRPDDQPLTSCCLLSHILPPFLGHHFICIIKLLQRRSS
jgi:hypothetical protein